MDKFIFLLSLAAFLFFAWLSLDVGNSILFVVGLINGYPAYSIFRSRKKE